MSWVAQYFLCLGYNLGLLFIVIVVFSTINEEFSRLLLHKLVMSKKNLFFVTTIFIILYVQN